MKRIYQLLWVVALTAAFALPANAQTTIYYENFADGVLPTGYTVNDVDGLTPHGSVMAIDEAWKVLELAPGDPSCYSTSYYTPAGQADDWLWTSALDLTSGNELRWFAVALDPAYADGYEVYVAPSPTTNPANAVKVFEIAAESAAWTQHGVNLAALGFSNQTVHIGFRNHSVDKFVLAIDDIEILELAAQHEAGFTGIALPSEYFGFPFNQNQPLAVAAAVRNNGAQALTNVSVTANLWQLPADTVVSSQTTVPLASLTAGTTHTFLMNDALPVGPGTYIIEYILNHDQADEDTSNDTTYAIQIVTDAIYLRDDADPIGSLGTPEPGYLGQSYDIVSAAKVDTIFVYHEGSDAGQPFAAAIWSTDANGAPDQIVATTDTLVWADDLGGYVGLPISGGAAALQPGNYVATAIQFDSTLQLGVTGGIFTPGTTWVYWDGIPGGGWVNNEAFGANYQISYVIRLNVLPLCQPFPLLADVENAPCNGSVGNAYAYVGGIVPPVGDYTFLWSNGAETQAISAAAGIYHVIAADENGCTQHLEIVIGEPSAITADVVVSDPPVFGQNGHISVVLAGGTAPYDILWSSGETTTSIDAAPGNYTFTALDANSCVFESQLYTVNSVAQPMSGDIVIENALCAGDAATLAANAAGGVAPYTYLWSTGETTLAINVTTGGPFSVVVTDQQGTSITFNSSVNFPSAITASTSSTNATCQFCTDGTASISASGGTGVLTYEWSNGQTTTTATGLLEGLYSCTITDANGCSTFEFVNVEFNVAPLTTTLATQWAGCPGNPATLTVTVNGGVQPYSYLWSNGATTASTTVFTSGNYTCTITDAASTTAVVSSTFAQPGAISGATSTVPATCSNCPDGSASVTSVVGGTSPYSFLWNNGGTGTTISNVVPGSYSVVITDANGCTSTAGANVTFTIRADEADILRSLDLFPNPTAGAFSVNAQLVESEVVVLKITAADGRLVFEKTMGNVAEFNQPIDLTASPAGVYMLSIQTEKGVATRPVVKL